MQLSLFSTDNKPKPNKNRNHTKHKVSSTVDRTWQHIKEWNTIEGIELIKPLNDLYSQLFILTFNNKLECLNYYVDEESDESNSYTVMYAEIKDTWNLSLKRRYELHIDLLARVEENDPTLEYIETSVIQENESGQLSLFG